MFDSAQNNPPTDSQIQVLMSDWLGNLRLKDEGNYTHSGKGGIKRTDSTDLKDYLVGDVTGLDNLELIKHARGAAKQVVNAVVAGPADVLVGGQGSFQAQDEQGKTVINIATDYFDDNTVAPKKKVGIMLGLAAHEAAHAVYTDNTLSEKALKKEPEQTKQLKHTIWNIIEDERIEYLLGDDRPGLAETLGDTKEHFFKKVSRDLRKEGKLPTEPIPKLLSALTQAVRYPSELTREEVVENFDQMDAIRKALTPYPLTPEGAWKAADRVMDIVRKLAEDEIEKQDQQQGAGGGQQPPQQGQQGGSQGQQDQKGQNQSQQGGQTGSGQQENKQDQGNSSPSGGKKPSKKQVLDAIQKALSTEEGKRVMNAIKKDEQKSSGRNVSSSVCGNSSTMQYVNDDSAECESGGPGSPKTFVFKPRGSADSYNRSLMNVRRYIPAMSKALACKSRDSHYVLHGLPAGKLNTYKLVALKSGNTNIFDKKGSVVCSSASVCMLIDESGSMAGEKLRKAREAAILVNESIARIKNVNFYCYGFTSRRLTVFSENGKTSKWALGGTEAVSGTPTGDAMEMAGKRIRRFTSDPVLMLVLTDGAADDSRWVMEQDKRLRGDGFIVIGVGIQSSYVSVSFKESIVVNDISSFPVDLGKITKGKLDKMLVRQDA